MPRLKPKPKPAPLAVYVTDVPAEVFARLQTAAAAEGVRTASGVGRWAFCQLAAIIQKLDAAGLSVSDGVSRAVRSNGDKG